MDLFFPGGLELAQKIPIASGYFISWYSVFKTRGLVYCVVIGWARGNHEKRKTRGAFSRHADASGSRFAVVALSEVARHAVAVFLCSGTCRAFSGHIQSSESPAGTAPAPAASPASHRY